MNQLRRDTVIIGVVCGVVCCGAWFGLVDPAARSLAAQRDREAALLTEVSSLEGISTDLAALVAAADRARRESDALLDRSRVASDDLQLMRAIHALAALHGLRIERVQPSQAAAPGRGPGDAAAAAGAAAAGAGAHSPKAPKSPVHWTARGMEVVAAGSYAGVLAMLDDMRRELGFTALRDVRLAKLNDPQRGEVLLELRAEHLAVSIDPIPTSSPASAKVPEAPR
jgi:hypothetical protein